MKAPEKIYLTSDQNNSYVFTQKRSDNMGVEYIRTDAFIEKAVKWLDEHIYDYEYEPMGEYPRLAMLDDFVNYMKGE